MNNTNIFKTSLLAITAITGLFLLAAPDNASAHCDTLDGPVIQDAMKAFKAKDITPVLKWVKPKDEKTVKAAFDKALAVRGNKSEEAEHKFFSTLVKIHRAGEGASFTGLKPAGSVEPAVAAADKALESGSADVLVKLITDDVAAGIKKRFEHAASAYKHKDESVAKGREFVEAYVAYTHYVEAIHQLVTVKEGGHGENDKHGKHGKHKKEPDHDKH